MLVKDKKEALKALKDCDNFYLLVEKKGKKSGYWSFSDYAALSGILRIAHKWFENQVLKLFKKGDSEIEPC